MNDAREDGGSRKWMANSGVSSQDANCPMWVIIFTEKDTEMEERSSSFMKLQQGRKGGRIVSLKNGFFQQMELC